MTELPTPATTPSPPLPWTVIERLPSSAPNTAFELVSTPMPGVPLLKPLKRKRSSSSVTCASRRASRPYGGELTTSVCSSTTVAPSCTKKGREVGRAGEAERAAEIAEQKPGNDDLLRRVDLELALDAVGVLGVGGAAVRPLIIGDGEARGGDGDVLDADAGDLDRVAGDRQGG